MSIVINESISNPLDITFADVIGGSFFKYPRTTGDFYKKLSDDSAVKIADNTPAIPFAGTDEVHGTTSITIDIHD